MRDQVFKRSTQATELSRALRNIMNIRLIKLTAPTRMRKPVVVFVNEVIIALDMAVFRFIDTELFIMKIKPALWNCDIKE